MGYKTVGADAEDQFIEKKSRFIGYISHTPTEQDAVDFISRIRAKHRKATHNCYAYILRENNISRHSDDSEPAGTAGAPIYEVLRKEGLTDVTCVVTRYFGGIKLGGGGLIRAYTNAAVIAVQAAQILDMQTADRLSLTLDYTMYQRIGRVFAGFDVRKASEDFGTDVNLTLYVRQEDSPAIQKELNNVCDGRIIIKNEGTFEYDFGKNAEN